MVEVGRLQLDTDSRVNPKCTLWTIGHSTHALEGLAGLLLAHGIEAVADVRRFPGSRRHPHLARDPLREGLNSHGIAYQWIERLGGRRRSAPGHPDEATGWRHPAFRAYAAYLRRADFQAGLADLIDLAVRQRTAIMCSEGLWWRCHRRLIADVLVTSGRTVLHIFPDGHADAHQIRPPGWTQGGELRYDEPGDAESRGSP